MIFDAAYMQQKFDAGMEYAAFVKSGEPEGHHHQWRQRFDQLELDDASKRLVRSFTREMRIRTLTGTWCGDCALQGRRWRGSPK